MSKKIKIVALFGPSASGKDTLRKEIIKHTGWNGIVTCTTRSPREGEKNGIDYYFMAHNDFAKEIMSNNIFEAVVFNGWHYGTKYDSLDEDKVNIGCFSQESIEIMLEDNNLKVYPVLICASDKTRLLRSLNREENPDCNEICRRFLADKKDFEYIDFDYMKFNNEYTINCGNLPSVGEILKSFKTDENLPLPVMISVLKKKIEEDGQD